MGYGYGNSNLLTFIRVLELPFRSDAEVLIEEGPDYFRFKAETEGISDVQPESTRPELASAASVDGELIVTVPKGEELDNSRWKRKWRWRNVG
ncbi:hypothetical protein K1719_017903 [Acacia pycnantha]|nr:hypothetical protein K1719_017903 [Acacia pycnantha]